MALPVVFRTLIAGAVLAVGCASALADPPIDVEINQAKILKLSRPADTVVIGNPQIADASVQDSSTIVLTGKGFGQTNLVVLAEDGSPISRFRSHAMPHRQCASIGAPRSRPCSARHSAKALTRHLPRASRKQRCSRLSSLT